jgi:hypothetical protein
MPADQRRDHPREDYLEVVPAADFSVAGATSGDVFRNRPAISYRRLSGGERRLLWVAFVVMILGELLRHRLGQGPSLAIAGPAGIVLVVLVVRLFIYRPDQ